MSQTGGVLVLEKWGIAKDSLAKLFVGRPVFRYPRWMFRSEKLAHVWLFPLFNSVSHSVVAKQMVMVRIVVFPTNVKPPPPPPTFCRIVVDFHRIPCTETTCRQVCCLRYLEPFPLWPLTDVASCWCLSLASMAGEIFFLLFSSFFNMFADLIVSFFVVIKMKKCMCHQFRCTFDLNFLRRHSNCNCCSFLKFSNKFW